MAKNRLQFKKDEVYDGYKLENKISGGGNGSVWTTNDSEGNRVIIKLLKKTNETAKKRFLDEIRMMQENQDISGVMRIFDHCELNLELEPLWYTMPIATDIQTKFREINATSDTIIAAIAEISECLSSLHERGVSHRDIKPPNLFHLENKYRIGDFGLVDYPDKEGDLTLNGGALGPRWTIAPEMRNEPENAEGQKADTYSLAKSLWILLTGIEKGFEGQYSPNGSVGLSNLRTSLFIGNLDDLLVRCTENDPNLRPTMKEFYEELRYWLECNSDYAERNQLEWIQVQQSLFPKNFPKRAEWCSLSDILSILKLLGGIDNLNHMMFPNGGGMDLKGAKLANEDGCIELDTGLPYVIKPKRLVIENFGDDFDWNYFWLELESLNAITETTRDSEGLTEVSPGEYKDYEYKERYWDEVGPPPPEMRNITRILKGTILIFRKTSSYNSTPETYDGRHSTVTLDEFRNYIESVKSSGYKVTREYNDEGYKVKVYYNAPMPDLN